MKVSFFNNILRNFQGMTVQKQYLLASESDLETETMIFDLVDRFDNSASLSLKYLRVMNSRRKESYEIQINFCVNHFFVPDDSKVFTSWLEPDNQPLLGCEIEKVFLVKEPHSQYFEIQIIEPEDILFPSLNFRLSPDSYTNYQNKKLFELEYSWV